MTPADRPDPADLSRRERQIMDIIYELEEASAAQIHKRLPSPPSYSSVRALLSRLESKGQIRHRPRGKQYVYSAVLARSQARQKALTRVVRTFFEGSAAQAITGLLGMSAARLTSEELRELAEKIEQVRKEGR